MDRQYAESDSMNERFDDNDSQAWISDLADDRLRGAALEQALDVLARDPAARETWQAYHLIGDVLRAPDLAGATPTAAFLARLSSRLTTEPAPVAPASPVHTWPVIPSVASARSPDAGGSSTSEGTCGRLGAPGDPTGICASP